MAYISFQPKDYFNTKLYTGNATDDTAITGVGFTPSFLWGKNRTDATNHYLIDAVRGVTKELNSNNSDAEGTDATLIKSFDSDGFTLGNGSLNQSAKNFVAWNWLAGGSGSSNTDGTINTTYTSASTTSGFSISTYTGTGSNATVGHGLGQSPSVVMVKRLNNTSDWRIYFSALVPTMGNAQQLFLNRDAPPDNDSQIWNNTAPTSSVFHVGTNAGSNASGGTYVAYCFAEKKGFSKFGSYTGNGSTDGSFIYTGFSPAFVIVKRTDSSANWVMTDNKISFNGKGTNNSTCLFPSTSAAESDAYGLMLHSNGFKFSGSDSASATVNGSGATYIYMAFSDQSIVSSNGVPATAR